MEGQYTSSSCGRQRQKERTVPCCVSGCSPSDTVGLRCPEVMSSLATVFRDCEEAERVLRDVRSLSQRSRDGGRKNCGCVTGTSSCVPDVS